MDLRRGLELSEKRSRSFNMELAIDSPPAILWEMYEMMARIPHLKRDPEKHQPLRRKLK